MAQKPTHKKTKKKAHMQPKRAAQRRKQNRASDKQLPMRTVLIVLAAIFSIFAVYLVYDLTGHDKDPVIIDGDPMEYTQPKSENLPDAVPVKEPKLAATVAEQPLWLKNAAPADLPPNVPKLVIVIDDLGYMPEANGELALMKGPLTLSYLPYGDDLVYQTRQAAIGGHELLVHLPMAPSSDADPGPHALYPNMMRDEFLSEVEWNLSRFSGYAGVNNHMGSLLTEKPEEMRWLMQRLAAKGLMFLDSMTTSNSVAFSEAKKAKIPTLKRDIFIDNERDVKKIIAQLEIAKRQALGKGYSIVIGHPYDETIEALKQWLPALDRSKVALTPLTDVMKEYGTP